MRIAHSVATQRATPNICEDVSCGQNFISPLLAVPIPSFHAPQMVRICNNMRTVREIDAKALLIEQNRVCNLHADLLPAASKYDIARTKVTHPHPSLRGRDRGVDIQALARACRTHKHGRLMASTRERIHRLDHVGCFAGTPRAGSRTGLLDNQVRRSPLRHGHAVRRLQRRVAEAGVREGEGEVVLFGEVAHGLGSFGD